MLLFIVKSCDGAEFDHTRYEGALRAVPGLSG